MFRDLKPYPRYLEAQVAGWCAPIPQHWTTLRLKDVSRRLEGGATPSANDAGLWGGGTAWATPTDMDGRSVLMRTARTLSDAGLRSCSARVFPAGAVIVSSRAPVGKVALAGIPMATSQGCKAIEPRTEWMSARFLAQQLRVLGPVLQAAANGTTFVELSTDGFSRLQMVAPPTSEQAAIVKYLGHAHARIDQAIAAKRMLIALLDEQKQAIINEAVTRGLDPAVPMKDSGILGLGEIPARWSVVRYKHHVDYKEGPGIMAVDFREAGTPLIRISCLRGVEVSLEGCNYLDPEAVVERWDRFRLAKGDYLLSASGSTGAVRPVGEAAIGAVPYTGMIRLRPKGSEIDMEYLQRFMSARPFLSQIALAKAGVGIEHFGPTHLDRMWLVMPPVDEQRTIVVALERRLAPLRTAEERARIGIGLLHEFRIRLTSDVVTGRLDVREIASTLGDFVEPALVDADTDEDESIEDLDDVLEETDA